MAIAFVQSSNARGSVVNSLAVVLGSNVTAGNALIGCYSHYETGTSAPVAPTSSPSNTWARDVFVQPGGGVGAAMIASALNVASGATTVTFDSGSGFYAVASVAEFSGLATSSALDKTATNSADSTTPTSGTTATTTQADELVVACLAEYEGSANDGIDVPATTGYTNIHVERDSSTYMGHASDYKIVSATGAQSAAWGTLASSLAWGACIATYKAAAGGSSQSITDVTQVASGSAFGTHTIANVAAQTITSVTQVGSGAAFGTHTIANVAAQSITPAQLASAASVLEPLVEGGVVAEFASAGRQRDGRRRGWVSLQWGRG